MNNIDLSDERYLVIENSQKNIDKLYNDLMNVLPERMSTLKELPKEQFIKTVAQVVLDLGPDVLKWIDFQFDHPNDKVVRDTETGNMFIIK